MEVPKPLLRSLGLTRAEAKVYLAALELGEASIQSLARKSGVKRTSIYNFIDKLKERQIIIETTKGKRNVYSATHPERLAETLKMAMVEFDRALPKLNEIHRRSKTKPQVTFFEGYEGIKEVYSDTLREKKPIVGWSDWEHMKATMESFLTDYPVERAKRGISLHTIARESNEAREVSVKDQSVLRRTKFLKSNEFKTEINIYGNKVAVMSFRSSPPFAVIVEDTDTAETLRTVWHELWQRI